VVGVSSRLSSESGGVTVAVVCHTTGVYGVVERLAAADVGAHARAEPVEQLRFIFDEKLGAPFCY